MPPKRVSLKGQGARLFYGEATAPGATDPDADPVAAAASATEAPEAAPADIPSRSRPAPRKGQAPSLPEEMQGETAQARNQPVERVSKHASTRARKQNGIEAGDQSDAWVDKIRKSVRVPGKEVVYMRVTPQEKLRLRDIAYSYQRQGTKTTDTEISRIAVNYILEDYEQNRESSVLARVIASMLA